jgi:hypothetical protein
MRWRNMPLLQVRDFPADIYEEISLKEQRRRLLERIDSRDIPESVKAIDPVKLIREYRDR